jgi:hypothetical protein
VTNTGPALSAGVRRATTSAAATSRAIGWLTTMIDHTERRRDSMPAMKSDEP